MALALFLFQGSSECRLGAPQPAAARVTPAADGEGASVLWRWR